MPGQFHLITMRCHQARFFMRPDPEINQVVLEWLARTQQAFPDVRLHAVCVMSNHLHLVVHDRNAELATWSSYFLGNLARGVNRIRKRFGTFMERRHSEEPILDDEALVDRLAYVVTNPVNAGLCRRVDEWPGVVLWAADGVPVEHDVSWIDRAARRRGIERNIEGRLRIDPLPEDSTSPRKLAEMIRAREQAILSEAPAERPNTHTTKKILKQSWHAAPRDPKRSPRPPCHASDPSIRRKFLEGFREFTARFREASEQLRAGLRSAVFPDWSYPPGQPLLRPLN